MSEARTKRLLGTLAGWLLGESKHWQFALSYALGLAQFAVWVMFGIVVLGSLGGVWTATWRTQLQVLATLGIVAVLCGIWSSRLAVDLKGAES